MNKFKHSIITLSGAFVVVCAFTASLHAQSYSDWSTSVNLGPTVNSAFLDAGPAISKDGLSLYFTSTRPGGFGGEDIYVSQRDSSDDPWGTPVNLGQTINTSLNERVPAFSRDGHLMFFASNRPGGFGNFDIWVSRREQTHDDFAWQEPNNLGAGVNSALIDAGASYFENDEAGVPQLYFTSNRSGMPGNFDIYVSEQAADGSFGPANLVLELNSPVEDSRPSIRHDGREIFIHSSRTGSIDNIFDVWVAKRDSVFDVWAEPINLGLLVNSALSDIQPYISSDRQVLFFASNRTGGFGQQDLYMSTRTKLRGSNE